MTTTLTDAFATQVWAATPRLRTAYKLWPAHHDREDGIADTVVKALANAHRFDGHNLEGWLTTIMRNVKLDQLSKGYRKGTKRPDGDRLRYLGTLYDYTAHLTCLCNPEAILIAKETYETRVA